jgi:PHP family Zn ribbon phosphoesterase
MSRGGLCPVCSKPVTVGVLHRVERLADRPAANQPSGAADFENLIPLKEVLGQVLRVGPTSVKVNALYRRLLESFGNELSILRNLSLERLEPEYPLVALALDHLRRGKVHIDPGYDGEYGKISLLADEDRTSKLQMALFHA